MSSPMPNMSGGNGGIPVPVGAEVGDHLQFNGTTWEATADSVVFKDVATDLKIPVTVENETLKIGDPLT